MQLVATNTKKIKKIPDYLVYEIIGGKSVYYQGYEAVLRKEETLESIMGSSLLQIMLCKLLVKALDTTLEDEYWVLFGELGLHISNKENYAMDISVYPKTAFQGLELPAKYTTIIPEIVIEIDTKASLSAVYELDYYHQKTQKLLDAGVQQVVWVFSQSRKVMIATAQSPWQTINWTDSFIVKNCNLNISDLLSKAGLK